MRSGSRHPAVSRHPPSRNRYDWSILTEAGGGREAWSYEGFFRTGTGFNNPPSRVRYIYPPGGSTDIPVDVVFSWSAFDPDGDELTYDLWYRREQDGDSTAVTGLTSPEYAVTLEEKTRYHWGAQAHDPYGPGPQLIYAAFTTVPEPEGIFADMTLVRRETGGVVLDMIWARFDEGYAPPVILPRVAGWIRGDVERV